MRKCEYCGRFKNLHYKHEMWLCADCEAELDEQKRGARRSKDYGDTTVFQRVRRKVEER